MCYMHFSKLDCYHLKKHTTTKRPASKCFLATRKALTASHLLKRWASSCRCLVYIFLNVKWNGNLRGYTALSMTESVAFCSFTSMDRRKMSFFLSQTKLGVKKREATMNWKVGVSGILILHILHVLPNSHIGWELLSCCSSPVHMRPWATNSLGYGCADVPTKLGTLSYYYLYVKHLDKFLRHVRQLNGQLNASEVWLT